MSTTRLRFAMNVQKGTSLIVSRYASHVIQVVSLVLQKTGGVRLAERVKRIDQGACEYEKKFELLF